MFFQRNDCFSLICALILFDKCFSIWMNEYEWRINREQVFELELEAEHGILKNELANIEKKIKILTPLMAIRRKLTKFEEYLAPELANVDSVLKDRRVLDSNQSMVFHEAKWFLILKKKHIQVDRIHKLLIKSDLSQFDFCKIIGNLYLIPYVNSTLVKVPPLNSFAVKELRALLCNEFEIRDGVVVKCIIDVLGRM